MTVLLENEREALLLDLHREVEEAAHTFARALRSDGKPDPLYPPNVELTDEEWSALRSLPLSPEAVSALEKLARDVASYPVWRLFTLLSAIAEPEGYEGEWLPSEIVQAGGDGDKLHLDWFESYWTYKERA